jgi:hypothetical protein
MIWIAKKFLKYANWGDDQDAVGRLQMAAAASGLEYTQILMALVENDDQNETVYIGLPALALSARFVGYEVVEAPVMPIATLLVGDQGEFEKHFRFPTFAA